MPVRIRLSRGGAKKRPFYRIVVADSRRSRDGKFIDQLGTYNPMLAKDNPERVKLDADKAKDWIAKGAQPSDRVKIFLSNINLIDKPIITEKTKKHLPKKKEEKPAEEKPKAEAAEAKEEKPAEEKPKAEAAEAKEEKPAEEKPKAEAAEAKEEKPAEEKPKAEAAEAKEEKPAEEKPKAEAAEAKEEKPAEEKPKAEAKEKKEE